MAGKTDLPAAQSDRFIEAARQLGADEDEDAFKAKLAQVARQKPKGDVPPVPEPSKDDDGSPQAN